LAAQLALGRPATADRPVIFQPGDAVAGEGGFLPPGVVRLT